MLSRLDETADIIYYRAKITSFRKVQDQMENNKGLDSQKQPPALRKAGEWQARGGRDMLLTHQITSTVKYALTHMPIDPHFESSESLLALC